MAQQGRLTDWNDERGFGYIKPLDGGPTVFAHISEFPRSQRRPHITDLLVYETAVDDRGRSRAVKVRFLSSARSRNQTPGSVMTSTRSSSALPIVAVVFVLVLTLVAAFGGTTWLVPGAYVLMSGVTFLAYGLDKSAAQNDQWRTGEGTLLGLGLLCGWPGGLVAQEMFRHKTKKQPFRTVFWVTVVINIVLVVLFVAGGQSLGIS
jgi:uncharacterized membrane protein YsdA (DUF1294 family)/cold shock CspA family protein